MKISTEIDGKQYIFELDRAIYKSLLQDEEYAKIQDNLIKLTESKKEAESLDVDSKAMLDNLILTEKLFYYSLKKNQPDMTKEEASTLMDKMIEEDGSMEYITQITQELIDSFIIGTTAKKKKRVLTKI